MGTQLISGTFSTPVSNFQHKLALKMSSLKLRRYMQQSYATNVDTDNALFDAVEAEVLQSHQVESELYSRRIFNYFPSVRLPFSGSLHSDLGANLDLIAALRQCAVVYEGELLDSTGSRGDSLRQKRSRSWTNLKHTAQALRTEESVLDVVVPVRNNGIFLLAKCLPSLAANKLWNRIRVLVVDDASDDELTLDILNNLEDALANVEVIKLNGNPSGSASVPRNVGLLRASSELVSFLDPDNEISVGGYDELVRRFYSGLELPQMATGFQLRVGPVLSITARHTFRRDRVICDPKSLMHHGRFPVISSQASVISLQFLKDQKLRFIEGAVGQDTVFGWEILLKADRIVLCSKPYIVYYAERTGSVTNEANAEYFSKALIRERIQAKLLKEHGMIEQYKKYQLKPTMDEIYKPKLHYLDSGDREFAQRAIAEICRLYGC